MRYVLLGIFAIYLMIDAAICDNSEPYTCLHARSDLPECNFTRYLFIHFDEKLLQLYNKIYNRQKICSLKMLSDYYFIFWINSVKSNQEEIKLDKRLLKKPVEGDRIIIYQLERCVPAK